MGGRQEIEISFFWIRCRANGIPALVVSFVVVVLAFAYVYTSVTRAVEVSEARPMIEITRPAANDERPEDRKLEIPPTLRKVPRKKEAPAMEWAPFGCWFCGK
jgi:hypothetical protein